MKIFCDNTGAIALAKESRFHKRTKHIKRSFNSIYDQVKEGDIEICKIHTDLNVADPLTKSLPRAKHDRHQVSMGARDDKNGKNYARKTFVGEPEGNMP